MTTAVLGLEVRSNQVEAATVDLDALVQSATRAEGAADRLAGGAHRAGAAMSQAGTAANLEATAHERATATARMHTAALQAQAIAARGVMINSRQLSFQLIDIGQSIPQAFISPLYFLQNLGFQIAQIGQLYMGQGGLRAALTDSISMAGRFAARLAPVGLAVGAIGLAFAGLRSEIEETTGVSVTFGDTALAVWQMVSEGVYNLLRPAIEAIAPWFATAWDLVKTYTKDAGNFIINSFRIVFEDIKFGVAALPDAFIAAANAAAQGFMDVFFLATRRILSMINSMIMDINRLGESAGFMDQSNFLPTIPMPGRPMIDFGGADAAERLLERLEHRALRLAEIAASDPIGAFFEAISGRAVDNARERERKAMEEDLIKGLGDQQAAFRNAYQAVRERTEALRIDAAVIGMSAGEAARYRSEQELLAAAVKANIELSPQLRQEIGAITDAYGQAAEMAARASLAEALRFERDQMFRTSMEREIAGRLQSAGLSVDLDSVEAGWVRWNLELERSVDLIDEIRGGTKALFSDLFQGLREGDLGGALGSFIDKLGRRMDNALSTAVSDALLGAEGAVGSGPLGGILQSIFGPGAAPDMGALATARMDVTAAVVNVSGFTMPGGGALPSNILAGGAPATGSFRAAQELGMRGGGGSPILDLIARAEVGAQGGYNTTLGHGAFIGGERNLTAMTLDQIDALQTQMLRNPANTFGASPAGRYQIVRTTLRDLREQMGLSGSELYSPDLQDSMAMQLINTRGGSVEGMRGIWEGLKHVDAGQIQGALDQLGKLPPVLDQVTTSAIQVPPGLDQLTAGIGRLGQTLGSGGGGIFGWLFGGGGGFDWGISGATGGLYANGGIATRPSIFGEAGPEAAVPLKGGRIPVELLGGGGRPKTEINVHNYAGVQVRTEETEDADGNPRFDLIIEGAVEKSLSKRSVRRNSGLAPAMLSRGR